MPVDKNAVVIIPSECFRWRPRVRFMESFPTQTAALSYAFQHNCNLIVGSNEESIPHFDVMQDPDGACTAGLDLELLKTEDVLSESSPEGWTALMLWTLWGLAKRLAALVAILYARRIVPLTCRAAAGLADVYKREMLPISRRAAVVVGTYLRRIFPVTGRAAAGLAGVYKREIVPMLRDAAFIADAYLGKVIPLFLRTVAFASLYFWQIVPILREAAVRCWADSKSVSRRHSWAIAAPHHSRPSQLR